MEKTIIDKKVNESEIEPLSNGKGSLLLYANIPKNESRKKYFISDTRRALSQYCASGALSLLMISFGTNFGFSAILIAELQSRREKDENVVSLSQLTWLSSLNYFAIVFGALFSGLLSQWIGRRNSLLVSTFPFMTSWIILYMCGPNQLWPIFLGLFVLGISGGIIESPLQIYVTEISEPRLRSSMCASLGVTIMIGIFVEMLLGKYLDWQTLALANIIFPILALMSLFFMPESPYWLASKGRYEDSLKALAWLRGWSPVSQLPQHEFQDIVSTASKKTDKALSIKRYFKRSTVSSFALVSFTFLVSCFNGSISLGTWTIQVFKEVNSPIEAHTAAVIQSAVQLAATVVMTFMFPYIGKRKPTLFSLATAGLALFVVAIYTYGAQSSTEPSWTPTIGILMAIGFSFLGIKHVPWILAGELFSGDVRSQMAGFLAGNCQIYSAMANKSFVYMEQLFTLPGVFLFFAFVNFVGLVVLYYIMPETEGKSLAEIERHSIDRKARRKKLVAQMSTREP
ncbi:facilitated trehalose transporter Tret1-like [Phymastichus coffea]|uniref:facilitated trehalose transporter Tret1-like n=1 Tax=Phymastichus coffea TaxID=108790 RepID=UPI00273BE587|nr:facilitated trehalose transporter Tret1-like [Phymastichus coffea]